MRKKWLIFVAAMTALGITACGSGDGIVINGTTAAEAESDQSEEEGSAAGNETTSGTKIEIITGESTAPAYMEESAAQSAENQTEAAPTVPAATTAPTEPVTTAAPKAASTTKAAAETTAAKKYNVSDVKKTMYATASVRVRSGYSTSSDVLAALADGEKVEVTGQVENGWMRVSYKGHVGYVSGSYLTETPPATKSSASASAGKTQASSQANTGTKPAATTGTGTTPGGTGGTAGPTAGKNSTGTTNPGSTAGPSAGTNSGTTGPGAGTNPGGGTNSGSSTSSGGSSVSGTVTSLDPSGVTVQASNGTSYQFVWGNNTPDLVTGDQVQISYETTSSGEKKITGVSK